MAYSNRGSFYGELGKFDAAISDFTRAIGDRPELRPRALYDYAKALELNPMDADVYNNRGAAYRAQGAGDVSIADHSKTIQINPNFRQRLRSYARRVGRDKTGVCSELSGVAGETCDTRASDLVLAGQAGDGTGTPDAAALNDGNALPRSGQMPGQQLAALSTA